MAAEFRKIGFSKKEISVFKKLNSPAKIQNFLDNEIPYNLEENGETFYSPKLVLRLAKAHCFEGAVFAATALYFNNFKPLLLDLRAVTDDDHVVAVFKQNGLWGAIGQSKFIGLRYREPIFPSIKCLALSYFENYFDWNGKKDLREYSIPFNLGKFGKKWMASEKSIEYLADALDKSRHFNIIPKKTAKLLRKVAKFNYNAEILVKPKNLNKLKKQFFNF